MIRDVGEDPLSRALRDVERDGYALFTTKFETRVLPVANF